MAVLRARPSFSACVRSNFDLSAVIRFDAPLWSFASRRVAPSASHKVGSLRALMGSPRNPIGVLFSLTICRSVNRRKDFSGRGLMHHVAIQWDQP